MKNLIALSLAFLVFITYSCKKKQDVNTLTNIDELSNYFEAATTGFISTNDDIRFLLKNQVDSSNVSDKMLAQLISLDPDVKGTTTLINGNLLIFKPLEPLSSSTTYSVFVDLPLLSDTYEKGIEYELKTKKQSISVSNKSFYINENNEISHTLSIFTADVIDTSSLRKCFSNQNNIQSINVINNNEHEVVFKFKTAEYGKGSIEFDGNSIGVDNRGKVNHYPLGNNFTVIEEQFEAGSKEIKFLFSKVIDPRQDLTGLVRINGQNTSTSIDKNILIANINVADESINVELEKGIKSTDNMVLKEKKSFTFINKPPEPEVGFLDKGVYFPTDGDFNIPIKTRNLKAVRIHVLEIKQKNVLQFLTWQSLEYPDSYNLRFLGKPVYDQIVQLNDGKTDTDGYLVHGIDLSGLVTRNPGSIYHVSLDYNIEHVDLACANALKKHKLESNIQDVEFYNRWEYAYRDYYYYYSEDGGEGGYDTNDPCKIEYYQNRNPNSKMLICSDYGLITKKAGNNYLAAITNLKDAMPVNNAEVIFYSLQGEELKKGNTDANGFVELNGVYSDMLAVQLTHNKKITYLKMQTSEANDITQFDVAGDRSGAEIETFAYTDRGVYRPGDSIYLDVMINKSDFQHPDGIPAVVEFYNPDNLIIERKIQTIDLKNKLIYHFILSTQQQAKTGRYRCVIKLGSEKIVKNINVETIKPNITESIYSINGLEGNNVLADNLSGSLSINYLTGFKVNDARVQVNVKPTINHKAFKNFTDYNFTGYSHITNPSFVLLESKTNDNGSLSFQSSENFADYQSPLNLSIQTETTLPSGGTSLEGKHLTIFPYSSFVGVKKNKGSLWDDTYEKTDKISFEIVNLSRNGKLNPSSNTINYKIYRNDQTWWLDKFSLRTQGKFYQDGNWRELHSKSLTISGKASLSLKDIVLEPGLYKVVFEDGKSQHTTADYFSIYSYEYYRTDQKDVKTIRISTDKRTYEVGSDIKLNIPKIKNSRALVTIERGNQIIEKRWVETGDDSQEVILQSNENWLPNAYISVMQIQPHINDNDLPIRTYGITHIDLLGKNKTLDIQTNIKDVLESNTKYNFTISEATGKSAQYTLALVDEGLLNITGFATPDPKQHFHAKYPLLVKTWDIYDKLMRYFKGNFAGIISIGGDDAYSLDNVPEINRFKPIVIHQGVFNLKANGKNTHTIQIPNYVGKLRLMVVAGNDNGSFGKLSKNLTVVNPIMVQSAHPRSLNISDKVSIPVTITRSVNSIKSADLSAIADNGMIKGYTSKQKISLNQDVNYVNYDIEVLKKAGKTKIDLEVKSGNKDMKESTSILVNYPNPYESKFVSSTIKAGESKTFNINLIGYKEVFTNQIQVSGFKTPNVLKYAADLIQYPYGCLEQTTSGAFSQLYLDELLDLSPQELNEQKVNLEGGVASILRMANGQGSFNYWSNGYYDSWADLYAGNFLIEYQKKQKSGIVSESLKSWIENANKSASNWVDNKSNDVYYRENSYFNQAYRLFILAKAGKPAKSAMNRMINQLDSKNGVVYYLLAATYQIAGFDSKANELIKQAEKFIKDQNKDNFYGYNYYHSTVANHALIVESLSYIPSQKKNMDLYYSDLVDLANKSWMSTYDKGYTFLALYRKFGSIKLSNKNLKFAVTTNNKLENINMAAGKTWSLNSKSDAVKSITIKNTGNDDLTINQTSRYIDDKLIKAAESENLNMTITYYNASKGSAGLDNVNLGDDITINVKVNNPTTFYHENLALNLRMPSGLELINPRINNQEPEPQGVQYQDYKDDRVYSFFELSPGGSINLNFKTKAAFKGDFFIPVNQCEQMYRGDVYAKSSTGRLVIK